MYGSTAAAPPTPPPKRSTLAASVLNLSNTIIGAGLLGLPNALAGTGHSAGVALLFAAAAFSAHGLALLAECARTAGGHASFYSVASAAVPRWTVWIDAAVACKCFGVASGYLITISDSMATACHRILGEDSPDDDDDAFLAAWLRSRRFWVVGAVVSVLPLSFYRTLDELKRASALALVFVFLLVVTIGLYAHGVADPCADTPEEECRGDMVAFTDFDSTVSKIPVFVFAFTCQQNIFPVVNEIDSPTRRRIDTVIVAAIGLAFLLFAVVALEGYRTFGSFARGDILLNYPENATVTLLRICVAVMLALHYPLQLDPSRRCVFSLWKVWMEWRGREGASSNASYGQRQSSGCETELGNATTHFLSEDVGSPPDLSYTEMSPMEDKVKPDSEKMFFIVTVSFLFLSFVVAMMVDDLGIVLALVGATGSTLVSYILPGLIYIKLHPNSSSCMAWVQLMVGLCVMPLALYFILSRKVVHGS